MSNFLKKISTWINGIKVSDIPENSDVEINQASIHTNQVFNFTNRRVINHGCRSRRTQGVSAGQQVNIFDNYDDNYDDNFVSINGEKIDLSQINTNQAVSIEIHGNVNNIKSISGNINVIVHGVVQKVKTEFGNIDIQSTSINEAKAEIGNVTFIQRKCEK